MVPNGVDQWGEAATSASALRNGREQSDSEQGIGSDQPLNVERGVRGNEISNIKERVGGGYRASDRWE
jgi:hypothetical protein